MDTATARAIYDLATSGRLSEDSAHAVAERLDVNPVTLGAPPAEGDEADDTGTKSATKAAAGSGR